LVNGKTNSGSRKLLYISITRKKKNELENLIQILFLSFEIKKCIYLLGFILIILSIMISCSKENTVEPALEDDSQSDFELINDETDGCSKYKSIDGV